ncbi:hypothetical protein BGU53_18320, partial [Clostridioides difficile]
MSDHSYKHIAYGVKKKDILKMREEVSFFYTHLTLPTIFTVMSLRSAWLYKQSVSESNTLNVTMLIEVDYMQRCVV